MKHVIKLLQEVIQLPLQIVSSNFQAIEEACRYYNGKPLINSVNGKDETMEAVFPVVKKYGGVVIGLALDENGIPPKLSLIHIFNLICKLNMLFTCNMIDMLNQITVFFRKFKI